MIRSFRSRLAAVSTGVLLSAAILGSLTPVAQAETAALQVPATITATPTTGLVSGTTVTVSATADTNWSIYSLRARLCTSSATIDNAGDFSPTLGGNCIAAPLADNTDSDVTVTTEPGSRGSATLDFKVGAGSNTFTTQYDGSTTIACGTTSTTGCKLVVEMSAGILSGRVIYKSFPLTYALPNAPTGVSAAWGNAKALVSWTASAAQTGLPAVTSYTATSSPGGLTCTTASTSCEISGLTNGTPYTFSVTGTNTLGESAASTSSAAVTPSSSQYVLSSTPTTGIVSGTSVAQTVTMSTGLNLYSVRTRLCKSSATIDNAGDFSPTLGGNCIAAPLATDTDSDVTVTTVAGSRGSAALDFKVGAGSNTFTTQYDGSTTIACGSSFATRSSCMLETEISYTTALGAGRVVYVSTPITYNSVPAAPTSVNATPGDGSASVSFTAGSNGGSTITGYTVSASPQVGGVTKTCTTDSTSCNVTGLTNGTAYTFTVKATNVIGDSLASEASSSVTPEASTSVPGAPTSVSGVSGNTQVTVSWAAPASNGGSVITGYTVSASPQVGGVTKTCTTASTSCNVTGLTNGTAYTFTVKATNVIGDSLASDASSSVTPSTVPGLPSGVYAVRGNGSVTIYWTAATDNGGSAITNHQVQAYNAAFGTAIVGKTCSNSIFRYCTISGLTNGTNYKFAVRANNVKGSGAYTAQTAIVSPSASVAAAPGVPTGVVITPGNREVKVSWTAPANNGATITAYRVQMYNSAGVAALANCVVNATASTATTCTITGLVNDTTYGFAVNATNSKGTSSYSTITQVQPNLVKVRRGNAKLTTTWTFTAPSTFGGSAFSSYQVQAYTALGVVVAGKTCTPVGAAKTCEITGLTNGTQYSVAVLSKYANGTSITSAKTVTMAPSTFGATAPAAPTSVTALAGVKQATVSWTAPAANGATVTLYTVQAYNPLTNVAVATKLCTTSVTSCAVTGLTTGTSYYFKVTARNDVGTSVASSATTSVTAG